VASTLITGAVPFSTDSSIAAGMGSSASRASTGSRSTSRDWWTTSSSEARYAPRAVTTAAWFDRVVRTVMSYVSGPTSPKKVVTRAKQYPWTLAGIADVDDVEIEDFRDRDGEREARRR